MNKPVKHIDIEVEAPNRLAEQPDQRGRDVFVSSVVREIPSSIDVVFNDIVPRRHPGRWLAALLLAFAAAAFVHSVATNENFYWSTVSKYLFAPQVIRGVGWTLLLTVLAMSIAVAIAITLVFMRQADNPILRGLAWAWIWLFRGTPVYTQLVFWGLISVLYPTITLSVPFGPQLFAFPTQSLVTPFVAAVIGLAFNESAYLTEIFRAGFNAIDKGQVESAQALGMKERRITWRIVMPQAMRIIIPPTGNETVGMLKTTSLVLAVPFTLDLTFATNAIANRLYLPIPLLVVSALWYLAVTTLLMIGQHYLERHFGKGLNTLLVPTESL
jgi:polar amino acid transport system permease protein